MPSPIANKLLKWYAGRKRSLPWRARPEPYAVWVAEIMAQQTRLETMLPYYERWMKRFPTARVLAAASEQEVLALWEGLGYYSRARNLHRAAQLVVEQHDGRLPADVAALRRLPGIGPYSAGAIASLAFGLDEAAVDGNAMRVLSRVFNVDQPVDTSSGKARIWALAREHLPTGRAADYNQALMDLGASLCAPQNPDCEKCPIRSHCAARRLGIQAKRPVRKAAREAPLRRFAAAVIRRRGRVLIRQRPARGLLAGMWEFPSVELRGRARPQAALRGALEEALGIPLELGEHMDDFQHTYSHFRAQLQVYDARVAEKGARVRADAATRWVPVPNLEDYPMGKLDRQIATRLRDDVG